MPTPKPGSPKTPTPTPRSRVLIADDNEPNRVLLEVYLAELDCEIATAVDGRDTLDKVASFQPHVILLDVMMPKLSGFEVCERLKSDPATSPIMILMVTALGELGDIERAVEAAIAQNQTTSDIGGPLGTHEVGDWISKRIQK